MRMVKQKLAGDNKKLIVPASLNTSSWCVDLPEDMVKTILKKLVFADQARFLAVCKSWYLKHAVPPPVKQLPWQFTTQFHRHKKGYSSWSSKLYDPIYKKTYGIENHDLYINEGWASRDSQVWASIDGWLLMSLQLSRRRYNNSLFLSFLFFYNPFTREQIKLPVLKSELLLATCAYPPTSPNCIVYAITPLKYEVTSIHAWRLNEETWRLSTVSLSLSSSERMVCVRDTLWCYSRYQGRLIAIKLSGGTVEENTWSEMALPYLPSLVRSVGIMEFNGELLIVCVRVSLLLEDGTFIPSFDRPSETPYVYKLLNQSGTMSWAELKRIGNRAIFITKRYAISTEVSNQSVTTLGKIEPDGIYITVTPSYLLFCSLKDGRKYAFESYFPIESGYSECVGYVEPPTLFCRRET